MAEDLVKIVVPLEKGNLAGAATESFWAQPDGAEVYRIKNVPFFSRGFSCDDLVKAQLRDGLLVYQGVYRHNGHSTYQVYVKGLRAAPQMVSLVKELEERQCDIEFATDHIFSVDVCPGADIYDVYSVLQRAEGAGLIDFQEGHCGHPLKSS